MSTLIQRAILSLVVALTECLEMEQKMLFGFSRMNVTQAMVCRILIRVAVVSLAKLGAKHGMLLRT